MIGDPSAAYGGAGHHEALTVVVRKAGRGKIASLPSLGFEGCPQDRQEAAGLANIECMNQHAQVAWALGFIGEANQLQSELYERRRKQNLSVVK